MGNRVVLVAKMATTLPSQGDYLGIDYGAYLLARAGKRMVLAIGDFDSVNVEQLNLIKEMSDEVIVLPREKDESDTESAIRSAREHQYEHIELWGAMQGRADHFLSNILLLYHGNEDIELTDEHNRVRVLKEGVHTVAKDQFTYLSLLVLQAAKVSIEGVKYPLYQRRIVPGSTFTVSNEIVADFATITVYYGKVIVIQSRDANKNHE